jgi:hypothetical protein
VAGLRGFELPNDDLSERSSTAGEGPTTLGPLNPIPQIFQSSSQTAFGGSNPLTPGSAISADMIVSRALALSHARGPDQYLSGFLSSQRKRLETARVLRATGADPNLSTLGSALD